MQEGVFALIDCLGWKGVWTKLDAKGNRIDPKRILKKIQSVERQARISTHTMSYDFAASTLDMTVRARIVLLSDTVAVSVPRIRHTDKNMPEEAAPALTVQLACIMIAQIINSFLEEEPYLTVRGCITYGQHLIRRTTLVGPAVDEAAAHYEMPLGAFVWLHPKAGEKMDYLQDYASAELTRFREHVKNQTIEGKDDLLRLLEMLMLPPFVLRDYEMPIKGGETLACHVLNPLMPLGDSDARASALEKYITSFDRDSLDVLLKKQKTMAFLAECADATREYYEQEYNMGMLKELKQVFFPQAETQANAR